jgi:glycosyltransferase involved in cell wall biosynthesis
MPRTIIEAMMMAKPVLATDIRGAREEVVAEETGLLVPTRSPAALAAAMERFIADPEWGRRLGRAGRDRALLLYDENRVVARQLERVALAARERGLL